MYPASGHAGIPSETPANWAQQQGQIAQMSASQDSPSQTQEFGSRQMLCGPAASQSSTQGSATKALTPVVTPVPGKFNLNLNNFFNSI